MIKLLENQEEDIADSAAIEKLASMFPYRYGVVQCFGVFDGATVTLECADSIELEWIDVGEYTTFTAEGNGKFYLPNGVLLRGKVSGAGDATDVTLGIL